MASATSTAPARPMGIGRGSGGGRSPASRSYRGSATGRSRGGACRGRSGQGQTRSRARRGEWQTRAPESSRARRRGRRAGERDEGRCSSAGWRVRPGQQAPLRDLSGHRDRDLAPPMGEVDVEGALDVGGVLGIHSDTDGVEPCRENCLHPGRHRVAEES